MRLCLNAILCGAVAATSLSGAGWAAERTEHRVAAAIERSYAGHRAKGVVASVDANGKRMTVKHGPVPSLNWTARSTTFEVLDGVSLAGIGPGSEVDFEFTPSDKGGYVITAIARSTTLDGRARLDGAGVPPR
jgi:membrane fusion protein, copper/silver efflux system